MQRRSDAPAGAAVAIQLATDPRTPATLYLASLAPGSRPTMASALHHLAASLGYENVNDVPWHELRYADTVGIRSWLAEKAGARGTGYSPSTANRYLAALRGVLRQAWRLGLMPSEAYHRAIGLEPIRGSRPRSGRDVPQGELVALFGVCNVETPVGARNSALLALLYGGGLRRREIVDLDMDDVAGNTVRVRRGKGNKARTCYLPAGAVERIAAWVRFRGDDPGPLLWPTRGGKTLNSWSQFHKRRMCPDNVRNILRALAALAGVRKLSPHDMRRTFVGDLLDRGLDVASVQQLCGHAHVNTTASYDRRPERARARAADLLHVPPIDPFEPPTSG